MKFPKSAVALAALTIGSLVSVSAASAASYVAGSYESAQKEAQYQGPTSRISGPNSNGQYLVQSGRGWRHSRYYRRHYR